MKLRFRNTKPKGVALAFALMTALLLMTLSTTVVGLSMRHARSGSESDYAQEALYAADWYLNASLDYMKVGGISVTHKNGYSNPYTDSTTLQSLTYGTNVLGRSDVSVEAIKLDTPEAAKEYGVNPGNDPKLVRFHQINGDPLVYFPSEDVSEGYKVNDRFSVCDVVIEKNDPQTGAYGTRGTPGTYHLTIYSRVYDGSAADAVKAAQASGNTSIKDYPTDGLLATRVIDVIARNEGPMDYLHIIQDGRSWRAQGINLDGGGTSLFNNLLANRGDSAKVDKYLKNGLNVCGFPINYRENGRMRIDGGTRMQKKNMGTIKDSKGKDVYIDGTANFFGSQSDYTIRTRGFSSEFTQNESFKTMKFNGQTAENMKGDTLSNIYRGGVRDEETPIGLPQSGENSNWDENGKRIVKAYKDRETYQKFAKEKAQEQVPGTSGMYSAVFDIKGKVDKNAASSGVYVGSVPDGVVPDVYSAGDGSDYRPSFAKIVVELGDSKGKTTQNNVFIYKENAGKRQLIKAVNSTKINNGIISVTGGNVEVRSHNNEEFDGDVTIVSDVEATREDSLNLYNVADNGDFSKKSGVKQPSSIRSRESIYSDIARTFFEKQEERLAEYKADPSKIDRVATRTVNGKKEPILPPYTIKDLDAGLKKFGIKGDSDTVYTYNKGKNAKAYVWPTPTSEATEREGNVYITSDIKCKNSSGKRGTVGIVAKNYVSLNDKDVLKKSKNDASKQSLNIEAMLFSFDKSVQFDWNNDAGNSKEAFNALRKNADKREFNLTGCVVSSNLDIEGSEEGVGYLIQEERSNLSVDNPAPYLPAYSEGVGRWVIVSYTDTGSRNWF